MISVRSLQRSEKDVFDPIKYIKLVYAAASWVGETVLVRGELINERCRGRRHKVVHPRNPLHVLGHIS